jgi:actin-like ATPase involved in cell morphogenesis
MNQLPPFIGIDFGTTNSSMAWFNPKTNQAEVIKNSEGEDKTPSLVYFGRDRMLVGKAVEELLEEVADDDNDERRKETMARTITSIKRNLISPPVIPIPGSRDVRPVEAAAAIIHKLKLDAEEGQFYNEINRAVITYPARFDATERKKIKEAATLAGLEVQLLREPEAAALAYMQTGQQVGKSILVYDLGGGTFDLVVVVREPDNTFRVAVEPGGDSRCGGDDFDQILYDYWNEQVKKELGKSVSLNETLVNRQFLRECRLRKENLSRKEECAFSSRLPTGEFFKPKITRAVFEQLIGERIDSTIRKASQMAQEAAAKGHAVDTIVLIGGSSYIPLVQSRLQAALGITARKWQHRDVAVALGAAYYAHQLWDTTPKPQARAEQPRPTATPPHQPPPQYPPQQQPPPPQHQPYYQPPPYSQPYQTQQWPPPYSGPYAPPPNYGPPVQQPPMPASAPPATGDKAGTARKVASKTAELVKGAAGKSVEVGKQGASFVAESSILAKDATFQLVGSARAKINPGFQPATNSSLTPDKKFKLGLFLMIIGVPLMLLIIGFLIFPIGLYLMIKGYKEKHAPQ